MAEEDRTRFHLTGLKVVVDRVAFCETSGGVRVREGEWESLECSEGLYGVTMRRCVSKDGKGLWKEFDYCGGGVWGV